MFGFGKKNKEAVVTRRVSEGYYPIRNSVLGDAAPLDNQTALEISAVLCAVRAISEGVAQIDINLKETYFDNGVRKERFVYDHPAYKLMQRPNSWQTRFSFTEQMIAQAVLGRGSLAKKHIVNGEVKELMVIPAGQWTQEQWDYGYRFSVRYGDGSVEYLSQDQVIYLAGLSLDSFSGISAIEKARKAFGIVRGLEAQTLKQAAKGGRPDGVFTYETPLSDEAQDQFQKDWQNDFGPDGKGTIAFLDFDAKFTPISQTAVDNQFIENRRFQVQEIARVFKIDPAMLMDGAGLVTEEVMVNHIINCLGPWIARYEQILTMALIPQGDNFKFDLDERDLLRFNFATQADYYQKMLGNGGTPAIYSVDDVRHAVGLDPIGDEFSSKPTRGGYEISGGVAPKTNDGSDK